MITPIKNAMRMVPLNLEQISGDRGRQGGHVVYFQRKPITGFHFSVEIIFKDVRQYLPTTFQTSIRIAPYFSKGVLPRLYMMVQAMFQQGNINHITGDISFIGILLQKEKTIQTILDCVFLQNKQGWKRSILKYFCTTLCQVKI